MTSEATLPLSSSVRNGPYPQLRHKIKMAAIFGDFVQRNFGEVIVLI